MRHWATPSVIGLSAARVLLDLLGGRPLRVEIDGGSALLPEHLLGGVTVTTTGQATHDVMGDTMSSDTVGSIEIHQLVGAALISMRVDQ